MTLLLAFETSRVRTSGHQMAKLAAGLALPRVLLWLRTVLGDMAGLVAIVTRPIHTLIRALGFYMAFFAAHLADNGSVGALKGEMLPGATGDTNDVDGALVADMLLGVAAIASGFLLAFVGGVAFFFAIVASRHNMACLDGAAMGLFVSTIAAFLRLTVFPGSLGTLGCHVRVECLTPVATLDSMDDIACCHKAIEGSKKRRARSDAFVFVRAKPHSLLHQDDVSNDRPRQHETDPM